MRRFHLTRVSILSSILHILLCLSFSQAMDLDIFPYLTNGNLARPLENWSSECEYTNDFQESCFDDDSDFQLSNNGESISQMGRTGYWTSGCNSKRDQCSVIITNDRQVQKLKYITLTTFLVKNSYVSVTSLKMSLNWFQHPVYSNTTRITNLGWFDSVIALSEDADIILGIIISIFNPERQGQVLVQDFRSTSDKVDHEDMDVSTENPDDKQSTIPPTRSPPPSSVGIFRKWNLYIITGSVAMVGMMMLVVIICTCIARKCPRCASKGSDDDYFDDDDDCDYEDEDLLYQLLIRKLYNVQTAQGNDNQKKETVFYSSRMAFGTSGKPVPKFYHNPNNPKSSSKWISPSTSKISSSEATAYVNNGHPRITENEDPVAKNLDSTTQTQPYYIGFKPSEVVHENAMAQELNSTHMEY